jgi:uncharacterized protein YcfJ
MNKKQISAIIGAVVAVAGALGVGGYSMNDSNSALESRIVRIENKVDAISNKLSTVVGYLEAKKEK